LYEVVDYLSEDSNSKAIQDKVEMGPSSISGILNMLSKFQLIRKSEEKHHYQLTEIGKKSVKQGEESFVEELRGIVKQNPIFEETLKYAKGRGETQFGFNDLVGYFRASGVLNFNPAKALAVIRLMNQTGYGIRKVEEEGKSGFFELDEGNSQ
jgi:DNA-binding PadR family transcriptional regulator